MKQNNTRFLEQPITGVGSRYRLGAFVHHSRCRLGVADTMPWVSPTTWQATQGTRYRLWVADNGCSVGLAHVMPGDGGRHRSCVAWRLGPRLGKSPGVTRYRLCLADNGYPGRCQVT